MELIKDTIINVIRGLADKKTKGDIEDPDIWLKKILTKKESQHIRFHYLRKGILGVEVDSSVWLYKFNLQKGDLLARLTKGNKAIKDIRFRIGEMK